MTKHRVLLVPGFLGFGNLGNLRYFVHIREAMAERFAERGLDVAVDEVATLPTASIRLRAARVRDRIGGLAQEADTVHVIGHSTGGLDVRLAIAPSASIPSEYDRSVLRSVRSVVSVSTPHYGTPLADALGGAMGQPLLRLIAAMTAYVLRKRRIPLRPALKLGRVFSRLDDYLGQRGTMLDQLYAELLADFDDERRRALIDYIDAIAKDQSLVFQLTSAGCDVLNAGTAAPERIRYGCVLTRAAPPHPRRVVGMRGDVYARTMHVVYSGLYFLAARSEASRLVTITAEMRDELTRLFGGNIPAPSDNDGIVPTLSQVWGEVIGAVEADHLDVVGHFGKVGTETPDADWLPTGSSFDSDAFRQIWHSVADFVADAALTLPFRRPATGANAPLQPAHPPQRPGKALVTTRSTP